MYDSQNLQYNVEIYKPGSELSFPFADLEFEFFNIKPDKPEPITDHCRKEDHQEYQYIQNAFENQQIFISNDKNSQYTDRKPKIIEISNSKLFRLKKYKTGRSKEIKNINQIFKTETLFYLNMLCEFKILSEQERSWVLKFKQESLSVTSFSKLAQKQFIKKKLQQFYCSTELIKRIYETQRLSHSRKLQVIKYINLCMKYIESGELLMS